MYSNSKKGFSILDLLVKIIFAALFIFIIIWLFNKKMPNMASVYSNQFRENIKFMQDAGEAYFTDDKMPVEAGQSVRLTLEEMENMNLVVPFVDKDGKACNTKDSYVSITKLENVEGYELKTYLVCGKESNTVVKTLGCHTYCTTGNCKEKQCYIEKLTEYRHKKLISGTSTKYSCPSGYTLKGSTCYRTTLKDSKSAIVKTTETKTYVKPARIERGDSKLEQLKVVVGTDTKNATTKTETINASTKTESINATPNTTSINATPNTETINASTKTESINATPNTSSINATPHTSTIDATPHNSSEAYGCTQYRTVTKCNTTYRSEAYSCNCTSTIGATGKTVTKCSTCYKSVPVENCWQENESYTGTCYRNNTTYSCPSGYSLSGSKCNKTTYSCPSGYSLSGSKCNTTSYSCPSGYSLSGSKCNRSVNSCPSGYTLSGSKCNKTTYSCPSGYSLSGSKCNKTTYSCPSGYSLSGSKCNKNVYSCPSGYTLSGNKCNRSVYACENGYTLNGSKCSKTTYSCPSGTDVQEGSGSSLKCYRVVSGSVSYKCDDSSYKLNGTSCVKTVTETVTKKECKLKGYKLEGDKCNLYETKSTKATAKTVNTSSYKYIWSKEKSVDGYTATGKTREVDGEEICK